MSAENAGKLKRQVERAAETALAERKFVTAIDVLVGLGWLTPRQVDEWRQGRVDYLERVVIASLGKISTAMRCFRGWAQARGSAPVARARKCLRRMHGGARDALVHVTDCPRGNPGEAAHPKMRQPNSVQRRRAQNATGRDDQPGARARRLLCRYSGRLARGHQTAAVCGERPRGPCDPDHGSLTVGSGTGVTGIGVIQQRPVTTLEALDRTSRESSRSHDMARGRDA